MNIPSKITFIISALTSLLLSIYFIYKGLVAYLIHKELYGGGIDALVASRWGLSGILIFLTLLFLFFIRIKDLKSQKTIITGIFIGWASICITLSIVSPSTTYYFIILTAVVSLITFISSRSLVKKINEERHSLSEKEIYLLQQLAKKK